MVTTEKGHHHLLNALSTLCLAAVCVVCVLCSFLPARPEKNLVESRRMTSEFIEERRSALERYLNRLAAHLAAARSEVGMHQCT